MKDTSVIIHEMADEITYLRTSNAKLIAALEVYAPADSECDTGHVPTDDTIDYCRFCREWADARAAIKLAKGD